MNTSKTTMTAGILGCLIITGCSSPKPWPESPLYENDLELQDPTVFDNQLEDMLAISGNYAHYDIVAYSGSTPNGPLNTFIVSYGFTRFDIEGDQLIQRDKFCFSEQKSNQPFVSSFSDEATQAIIPIPVAVEVTNDGQSLSVYRPQTPTLLGMEGNPNEPLPMDKNSELIIDDDGDGKPGVTVDLNLFGLI
ncbi:MAG: hypothetical protein MI867_27270, partial [Pseudomonadales bacterium]|nr:hypothetical protein [Pseudomonadales bacterium]